MESSNISIIQEISQAVQQEIAPLIAKIEAFEHRTAFLESLTEDTMDMSKGEIDMPKRYKYQIALSTGEKVWITGNSPEEAFRNGLKKYGSASVDELPTPSQSFGRYVAQWWDLYKVPKHKPSTLQTYRNLLDKHLLPFFGDMSLGGIKTNDVQCFINGRNHMAKSSVRQMIVLLHEICVAAVEDGYLQKDPTISTRLTLPKRKKIREALSTEKFLHVLEQLPQLNIQDARLLALLAYTGIRRGEALGLQWADIDTHNGFIHVRQAVTYVGNQPIIGTPKSDAGNRMIPLVDSLRPYLEQAEDEKCFVVGGKDKPITESTFDRAWQRINKTIDLHGATPHVLRHTFLTMLGATGTDVKTLQSIGGHADIQTTMNRYVHNRTENIQKAGQSFQSLTVSLTHGSVQKAL